ncbi:hypothetical protein SJAV_21820 [Sulfurisphaera javensis]|uniref:Cellulase n=1 Tax=Sulfurisphaera javensis TaxID=2049879 RepID=A0AAT9GTP4_9CREN
MRIKIVIIIVLFLILSFVAGYYIGLKSHQSNLSGLTNTLSNSKATTTISDNSITLTLFPGKPTYFSMIGNYLADSEYGLGEIYGVNTSLYISPYMWNVKSAKGVVNMTVNPFLHVTVNLTNVQKITPTIMVDGYPDVIYGDEPFFPVYNKTIESPYLELPELVEDLPTYMYSYVNFSVWDINGTINDFSYDIWLSPNPYAYNLHYGDYEIMIWMYWQQNLNTTPGFLKYAKYLGITQIPTYINGTYYSNWPYFVYILPQTGSAGGWTTIYFISVKPIEGLIGFPIASVLKNMGSFLIEDGVTNYDPYDTYLLNIRVGMEFNGTNVLLGYNLYQWYIIEEFHSTS